MATLCSLVAGRKYPRGGEVARFQPLIRPAGGSPPVLSFWNLIEAHVLRALRAEHGISIKAVRESLAFAERKLKIERLLLSQDLRTFAGEVFLEEYGKLTNLSASGQFAMRTLFEEHLRRVEWDEWKFPVRLYPYVSSETVVERTIAIDPQIAFGRPIVARAGVTTGTLAERIDAREPLAEVAADYGLTAEEVEQAILYERAACAGAALEDASASRSKRSTRTRASLR